MITKTTTVKSISKAEKVNPKIPATKEIMVKIEFLFYRALLRVEQLS